MSGFKLAKLGASLAARSTQLVEWGLSAGLAALAWPAAIGGAMGVLLLQLWPGLGAALHHRHGGSVLVLALALFVLGGCAAVARASSTLRFADVVRRVQRFGAPLLLGPVLLALRAGTERSHPFLVLGLAVATAWIVSRWLRAWYPNQDSTRDPGRPARGRAHPAWLLRHGPAVALGLLVSAYTVTLSWLSIANHLSFNTGRADLGFYVSIFRRSSLGDPLGCTICGGGNHLSGHFDPLLVVLSPLYLLHPEAETVLVLQSLLLGSTMLPLYLLARHHGIGQLSAVLLCVAYGLHPALHGINLFDFHSLALLVPAAVWLLWARDTGRTKAYWAFFVTTLLVREDAALVAACIGIDTLLTRKQGSAWRGLVTIVVALVYFVAVKALLMDNPDPLNPSSGGGYAYYYQDLVPKGTGTLGLVTSVLSQPHKVLALIASEAKVLYWLQLLVPLLGLPLLAWRGRFLLLYGAAFTLLASREHVYSVHFHYSSVIVPFLFYLCIVALSRPKHASRLLVPLLGNNRLGRNRLQTLSTVALLAATLVASWRFGGIVPNRSFHAGFRPLARTPSAAELARDQDLKAVCRFLPEDKTVAANEPHLPHLGRCAGFMVKKRRLQADYLVWTRSTDARARSNPTHQAIQREIKKGYWKKVRSFGGFDLFENTAPKEARKMVKPSRSPSKPPKRRVSPKPARPKAPAQSSPRARTNPDGGAQ